MYFFYLGDDVCYSYFDIGFCVEIVVNLCVMYYVIEKGMIEMYVWVVCLCLKIVEIILLGQVGYCVNCCVKCDQGLFVV